MDPRDTFISIGEQVVYAVRDLARRGPPCSPEGDSDEVTALQSLFRILLTLPVYALRHALADLSRSPLVLPVPGGKALFEFRYLRDVDTNANGGWEVPCLHLMRAVVQRGDTVLDVGAHVGFYSLLAAELVGPEGRVYAFEPAPDNHERLEQNLRLNGLLDRIRIVKAAVCERPHGVARFFSGPGAHGTEYTILAPGNGSSPIFESESTSIDAFVQSEGIESIDFIKIDVEGAELQVLEGARKSLEEHADAVLLVELHPDLTSPVACCRYLADRGFMLYDVPAGLKPVDPDKATATFVGSRSLLATRCPVEIE